MRIGPAWLHTQPVYLWIAFCIPALASFGHALAPGQPVFKGQDLGIVVALALTGLAVAAWLPYTRRLRWPIMVYVFLGLALMAWTYQIVRTQLDQSLFNLTVVAVPVVLAMIAIKPAPRAGLDRALLSLGYSLLAVSAASLVFGGLGWMPSGFDVTDAGYQRWIILDWTGIPSRWGGPFGSVNYASPVGGLLIVIGATRGGLHRWVLVGGGLVILGLGQARTSMLAVVAALLVVVLWSPTVSRLRCARATRWAVITMALVLTIAYVGVLDPTLNGRTPIWADFIGLLPDNIVFGVGDSGILAFVGQEAGNPGFVPHTHVHSVLLDGLVRYGTVMAVLTLTLFALAVTAGVRTLRESDVAPMSVTVFVIAAGIAETLHSWNYWTVYLAALTWVVLAANESTDPVATESGARPSSVSFPGA